MGPRAQRHRRNDRRWGRRVGVGAALGFFALALPALQGQAAPAAPVCRAVQLEPYYDPANCGMGRCEPLLDFRNVSSTACPLPAMTEVRAVGP